MEVKSDYKLTEAGVIPEEWEARRLDDCMILLTDFESNGSFEHVAQNVHVYNTDNFAWYVRATDLENESALTAVRYVDEPSYRFLKKTSLFGNEVLITKRGEIGKVYQFKKKTKFATLAPNLYLLKLNDLVLPAYVYAYFRYGAGNVALKAINSSTTLGALYKDDVKALHLPIPPLSEQHAIATALSDVDALLGGLNQLIAKKRDLKQAAMQQLLTGQTRLPGFSGAWEVTQVGGVVREGKQTQRHAGTGEETASYRFFTNNTQNYATFLNQYDFDGEAVIANTGGNAFFQYYRGKFAASMHCLILLPRINAKFLYYALKLRERLINEGCFQGSGLKVLHKKSLRDLAINFPKSSEEQAAIAAVLTDTDVELAALEARREKTAQLKLGILQELLTGRIRLVEAEALNA